MMPEDEIRRVLAAGNPVCPECSNSIMKSEYNSDGKVIFICPECGYDIEEDYYDYLLDEDLYNDVKADEPDTGCQTCGGPYPQCKTACSRFDD